MTRPAPRALALGLAVLVAATAGWLVTRPSGPRHTAGAAESAPPTSGEVADAMQLLDRHASALLGRDRAGWAAGIDSAGADAGYAGVERATFDNLAGVPLTTWSYVLVAPVTDPAVLTPVAARLGARVAVLHVQLRYALARVDPLPTAKDEWLTLVRRATGWRLAGDGDAQQDGGASWRGPWAFGPLVTRSGPHTLVLAHPAQQAELATFAALVEQSIPVVAGVWGTAWNEQVAVLLPSDTAEFQAVTGDQADSHDLAALAIADSVAPAPDAAGRDAVLGARIVLNPMNLGRLDAAGRRLVVQHELTHLATRAVTDDQMPTWLIEGFADYVGNLDSGRSVPAIAPELAGEVRGGRLPAALPTAADFDGGDARLAQVYEESWLACRLVAERIGQHGLVDFYRTVAADARQDPGTALADGLRADLHLTPAAFTAAWRGYLSRQLAGPAG
ncbi:MAG TPA: hypothetical protein VMB79_15435 [Jatrophihabitans sp.]|nr:hypothetical protein [Jatrophihabitans sp.]